jgi:hypothetical protein
MTTMICAALVCVCLRCVVDFFETKWLGHIYIFSGEHRIAASSIWHVFVRFHFMLVLMHRGMFSHYQSYPKMAKHSINSCFSSFVSNKTNKRVG